MFIYRLYYVINKVERKEYQLKQKSKINLHKKTMKDTGLNKSEYI